MSVQGYDRPHGEKWRAWRERGDERAREGLYAAYAYLVPITRERFVPVVPVRIDTEDLLQEGCLGLLRATQRFDPRRPVKFESLAITCIAGSMLEHLRGDDWAPRSVRTKQKLLKGAEEKHERLTGRPNAKPEELAALLEMDIDAFFQFYREATVLCVASMEDEWWWDFADNDGLSISERLVASDEPSHDVNRRAADAALWKAVAWLPRFERLIVTGYYRDGKTLKALATEMGRSESRAHQLHSQATTRLAGFLRPVAGLWGEG